MKQFIARLREKQSFYAYTDENLSDLPQLLDRLEKLEAVAEAAMEINYTYTDRRHHTEVAAVPMTLMMTLDDALAALNRSEEPNER